MPAVDQIAEATPAPVITETPTAAPQAPAVELNTDIQTFSPEEYRAWQKDGTVPEKKAPPKAEEPKKSDAAPDGKKTEPDTAKAGKAETADEADADEQPDAGPDDRKRSERRKRYNERKWENMLRENAAMKTRLELLEQSNVSKGKADTPKADAAPAKAEAKDGPPKAPRFKDFEDKENGWDLYEEARDEHARKLAKWETKQALDERDTADAAKVQKAEAGKAAEAWSQQIKKAAAKYEDFNEVAAEAPTTDLMNGFMVDSDVGAEMLYYFGENPEEAKQIGSLAHTKAIRALVALESKLTEAEKPAETEKAPAEKEKAAEKPPVLAPKQVTKAGRPPVELPGTLAATDAIEEAIARGNYTAYEKEANAREARARRGG